MDELGLLEDGEIGRIVEHALSQNPSRLTRAVAQELSDTTIQKFGQRDVYLYMRASGGSPFKVHPDSPYAFKAFAAREGAAVASLEPRGGGPDVNKRLEYDRNPVAYLFDYAKLAGLYLQKEGSRGNLYQGVVLAHKDFNL